MLVPSIGLKMCRLSRVMVIIWKIFHSYGNLSIFARRLRPLSMERLWKILYNYDVAIYTVICTCIYADSGLWLKSWDSAYALMFFNLGNNEKKKYAFLIQFNWVFIIFQQCIHNSHSLYITFWRQSHFNTDKQSDLYHILLQCTVHIKIFTN